MSQHRWPGQMLPDELGVVVHQPVVLARAPGVAVGLRCVFAHPGGLHLPLVLVATGVPAGAAARLSFPDQVRFASAEGGHHDPWSGLRVVAEVNGFSGPADPSEQQGSGGDGAFDLTAAYWIGDLPADRRLRLTVGWPEIGLPHAERTLVLDSLDNLPDRVLSLR